MSNIMLIYPRPDVNKKPRFGFSHDLLMIATILEREGYKVILKDFSCEEYDVDSFTLEIVTNKIETVLVEFDSFSLKRSENYSHGQELVETIKSISEQIVVIAFGHFCCISKRDIDKANYTVKENAYNSIIKILNDILGSNKKIPSVDGLDSLPIISRKLLNQIDYFRQNSKSTLVQTSVGCENSCVFCQRKGWQKEYQAHSDKYVLEEFTLLKECGYINVWVIDENFTFNLHRAKRILRILIENKMTEKMKIFISSWSNIDTEFIDLASRANIKAISFGIESGNPNILKFYKKNIDLVKTKFIIQYANETGIFTIGNFIIGAPMESYDTIDDTFRYIRECEFDQVNIKTLDYMMGSELYMAIERIAQGRTHMFACKENGINQFSLQEIFNIKSQFLNEYYNESKNRINCKIRQFGTPYDI